MKQQNGKFTYYVEPDVKQEGYACVVRESMLESVVQQEVDALEYAVPEVRESMLEPAVQQTGYAHEYAAPEGCEVRRKPTVKQDGYVL